MALNVIMNIQFFVNNRVIQLLVANRLLINYLSIYLSKSLWNDRCLTRAIHVQLLCVYNDVWNKLTIGYVYWSTINMTATTYNLAKRGITKYWKLIETVRFRLFQPFRLTPTKARFSQLITMNFLHCECQVPRISFFHNLRATSRNYQLQVEIVKKWPPLKLRQNEALWALVTKSLV